LPCGIFGFSNQIVEAAIKKSDFTNRQLEVVLIPRTAYLISMSNNTLLDDNARIVASGASDRFL
jgi:hypothetical protein